VESPLLAERRDHLELAAKQERAPRQAGSNARKALPAPISAEAAVANLMTMCNGGHVNG
jgi:hypothetical protein